MTIERMTCSLVELKLAGPDTEMAFSGYGAVFGNLDSYGDVIQKGAFARTIHEAKSSGLWPAMLEQHGGWGIAAGDLTPIGVWTDMDEDDVGLKLSGKFAPTPRGQEMYALMRMTPRPAINGLSIGYQAVKWRNRTTPEEPRRTLEEVKLWEISPVTFPANGKARVSSVKTDADPVEQIRNFERWLMHDAGLTRSDARVVINQGFKALLTTHDAGNEIAELAATFKRGLDILQPHH